MNATPSAPALRAPRALQITLWIIAIGAPSFALYTNGVRDARRDAEQQVIEQVARTIQSPSSDRVEVLSLLAMHEREVSRARYSRTRLRLATTADRTCNWGRLFDEIARRSGEEQQKAAHAIANECGMSPDSTLKMERMRLSLTPVAATSAEVPQSSPPLARVERGL